MAEANLEWVKPGDSKTLWLPVVALGLLVGLSQLPQSFGEWMGAAIPFFLFGFPIWFADRRQVPLKILGIDLGGWLEKGIRPSVGMSFRTSLDEFFFALGLAAITLPTFVVLFFWWFGVPLTSSLAQGLRQVPAPWSELLAMLVSATAEEFFFRGYFQSHLTAVRGNRGAQPLTVMGAKVDIGAWLFTAFIFALMHLTQTRSVPSALSVFFPGLLFGWIRLKRGGIGAASLYHWFCNICGITLSQYL